MDEVFMMYAEAASGDFTAGQRNLKRAAAIIANNYHQYGLNPNDPNHYKSVCSSVGFNYDSLLNEEVDYLANEIKKLI